MFIGTACAHHKPAGALHRSTTASITSHFSGVTGMCFLPIKLRSHRTFSGIKIIISFLRKLISIMNNYMRVACLAERIKIEFIDVFFIEEKYNSFSPQNCKSYLFICSYLKVWKKHTFSNYLFLVFLQKLCRKSFHSKLFWTNLTLKQLCSWIFMQTWTPNSCTEESNNTINHHR